MGGVEDDEPPSKRVKVSFGDSGGLSNGKSVRELSGDSMARLPGSQEDNEVVGSKGVIKKAELVRIITEALYSLGYSNTGADLEAESGIPLHSPQVRSFMKHILDGKWDESVTSLNEIGLVDTKIIKMASFIILEQKFFELLGGDRTKEALTTLRNEITPLSIHNDRVRELSAYMVSPKNLIDGTCGLDSRSKSRKEVLEELQKLLPPTVMIPEKRLVHLVEQALDLQKDTCRFHNSVVGQMSLLTDHQCGKDKIPSRTLQILQEHNDEVWFLQFSHNGKYLASSSSDCLVIIWEVDTDGHISLKHKLSGHQKPVSNISWSPDNEQFLTCGAEEAVRRWSVSSGECLQIYEKSGLGLVSCGWALDGKSIFSGVTDKSIIMWDLEGKEVECWKGQRSIRIADLEISASGKELITVCKDTAILIFGWETKSEKFIQENHSIISFALSEDKTLLLVSLSNGELHLWNIDDSPNLVARYKGHTRSRYVVRCCFGGLKQSFIASGSEDSQVYIWHRSSRELVKTLTGHSGAVNCVSWNPANPHMLASASDDRTIRVWGIDQIDTNCNRRQSNGVNGVHYCNGNT